MAPLWIGFITVVLLLLWLDLGVLNRKAHVIHTREAIRWTIFWFSLAMAFSAFLYFLYLNHWFGTGMHHKEYLDQAGNLLPARQIAIAAWQKFITGYVVEATLSLDNVFVIALIFEYFRVPPENQHRTLFWGIMGAMIFRGVMIGLGAALLHRFEWMMYVFGVILLLTALKMLFSKSEHVDPDHNPLVRFARKLYPVTGEYFAQKFFVRLPDGRRAMTPLFLVLLVIESTDIVFAVDSIPAIFGITSDPFIVFSSNVFAILGLRSLYFALAGMMRQFQYIKPALVFVLLFISVKMLLPPHLKHQIPGWLTLSVIFGTIAIGVIASLVAGTPAEDEEEREEAEEQKQPTLPPAGEFDEDPDT